MRLEHTNAKFDFRWVGCDVHKLDLILWIS